METRKIAEAVILQSIEDMWQPGERSRSIDFFRGDGFRLAAEMAGMDEMERSRILRLIGMIPGRIQPLISQGGVVCR